VHNPRRQADGTNLIIIRWPRTIRISQQSISKLQRNKNEARDLRSSLCTSEVVVKKCFGADRSLTQRSNGTNTGTAANDVRRVFHRLRYFPQLLADKFAKNRRRLCVVSRFWIRASGIFHVPSLFCGFVKSDNPAASSTECLLTPVILGPGVLLR
jgi:hypothetical protein